MHEMEKATLPVESACEPVENARQILGNDSRLSPRKKNQNLLFSESTKKCDSQNSVNKEILSQPRGLSHRERLHWLQKRRTEGLWVQCDACNRWRYLPQVIDRYELPQKWYCKMNPDSNLADCSAPEESIQLHDEEDLIHSRFTAGSIVWARLPGWPWWPAMVDDCPDTEQFYWLDGFSDIPTHYNVVFFDKCDVTRAWVSTEKIKSYATNKKIADRVLQIKKYRKRLILATKQADEAVKLPLASRLAKYSFIVRYKGNILSPTHITKADIEKHRNRLKRQFNIEFPTSSSDSENDLSTEGDKQTVKNKNFISGTPKINKVKQIKPKKIFKKNKVKSNAKIVSDGTVHEAQNNVDEKINESNSLMVNVDSAQATALVNSGPLDNDTSSTYVPDSLISNTEAETQFQFQHAQAASPGSGDFEF